MSLNNRISIRSASVARGGLVRSAGLFPDFTRSEATTDIVLVDVEKFPNSPKTRPLEETESQGGSSVGRTSPLFALLSRSVQSPG